MLFDVCGKPLDLLALVVRRNDRKDRLVKSAAHHFHLLAFHERAQQFKIFRVMFLDPGQQRPRIVQSGANFLVLLEVFDERQIRALVAPFKYVFKISDGLVRVNQQGQMKFCRHGNDSGLHP